MIILSFTQQEIIGPSLENLKEFIIKQSDQFKLWLYVDGIHADPERIRNDIISSAKEIILTRALVGG